MTSKQNRPAEEWQRLLVSHNVTDDLWTLYPASFIEDLAERFDRHPQPIELMQGVLDTGSAYLEAKWLKQVERGNWLKYSGTHLISAGLAARKLSGALTQLSRSAPAAQAVQERLSIVLAQDPTSPNANLAHEASMRRSGPQARLATFEQLASALEAAIANIIPLPDEYDEEKDARDRARMFVEHANAQTKHRLPKNHAVEEAARAFKPLWEDFSTVPYRRGRYRDEVVGYNCEPGAALHQIIARLDSTVALSLVGNAINKIWIQSKGD